MSKNFTSGCHTSAAPSAGEIETPNSLPARPNMPANTCYATVDYVVLVFTIATSLSASRCLCCEQRTANNVLRTTFAEAASNLRPLTKPRLVPA